MNSETVGLLSMEIIVVVKNTPYINISFEARLADKQQQPKKDGPG